VAGEGPRRGARKGPAPRDEEGPAHEAWTARRGGFRSTGSQVCTRQKKLAPFCETPSNLDGVSKKGTILGI
jgi:hypothetical protein